MNQTIKQYRNPWKSENLGMTYLALCFRSFAQPEIKKRLEETRLLRSKSTLSIRRKQLRKMGLVAIAPDGRQVPRANAPYLFVKRFLFGEKAGFFSGPDYERESLEFIIRSQKFFAKAKMKETGNRVFAAFGSLSLEAVLPALYIFAMEEELGKGELESEAAFRRVAAGLEMFPKAKLKALKRALKSGVLKEALEKKKAPEQ